MESDFNYHILNRGVEKRKIFLDKEDYLRFVHNLSDFNDENNAISYFDRRHNKNLDIVGQSKRNVVGRPKRGIKKLVDVLCWCLIPTHHHIQVQEKVEGGASKFSQKLTIGHTKYFNIRNERTGVLFQGRSKIILIQKNEHFLWLPFYIMANPLDLFQTDWREKGVSDPKKAFDFLLNYKYSSFPDIMGQKNFPDITDRNLFYEIYNTNEVKFRKDFIEWLVGRKKESSIF